MSEMLNKLREARAAAVAAAEELLSAEPTTESLDAVEARTAEIKDLDEKIEVAHALEQRTAAVAESRTNAGVEVFASVRVGAEPATYRSGGEHSYFRDLFRSHAYGDRDSTERLQRNNAEIRTANGLNTTDTTGGDLVPVEYLTSQWVAFARAQRVLASEINLQPLPSGTDSIVLPRLTGGTAVAEVSTQNSALQETDAVTDSVTASVTTLAGIQRIAIQLLDQSPVNVDQIIMQDLAGALAQKIDQFVISNNASGKYGVTAVSGINSVAYTTTSPTAAGIYSKIMDGVQQIHTGRFAPATKVFMHPRRWAAFVAATDSSGRPLVLPDASGAFNAMALQDGGVVASGYVGRLGNGLPVYLDANIPTNLGAGTNQDQILIVKHDDLVLYESAPKAEVFRETYADQGSVLVRLYEYLAFQGGRYPKSISVVGGTGLVTPSF